MTVVGGLGTFAGPMIGAAPIQILNSYVAKYGEWDMVISRARGDRADARQYREGSIALVRKLKRKVPSASRLKRRLCQGMRGTS